MARQVFVCEACGETLHAEDVGEGGIVSVTPCPACVQEAYERGTEDAYSL